MKKSELLVRIIALENIVTLLQSQIALKPSIPQNPWGYPSPTTAPTIPMWPTTTVCEAN
jgi:hypothetical protein